MSKKVYLDSAATTCLLPEVIDEMVQVLQNDYGNPSSTHSFGRSSKTLVESSRKSIAKHLNCSSSELIFTSSGTEATNWILNNAVKHNGIKRIISSKIEHHATLYTVLALQKEYNIQLDFVNILPTGSIDYNHLSELLNQEIPTLVSLMHVNNEIGTQLDVSKVGKLCKEHKALFHCDTVQSIGKSKIDLELLPVDFLVASAHKFHGPKGIGFAYVRKGIVMQPMTYGGAQEKGLRAGTEAVHQIAGMAKAFDLGHENLEKDMAYISDLKNYCIEQLLANFPDIRIVGENTFYNIINFILPFSEAKTAMMLFNLDIKGIAVSRGSACQSGSVKPSHVLSEILSDENLKKPNLRVSFCHTNTKEDIDMLIEGLKST
ncbi:cysteine desulfurase family protein [Flavobacterium sp.]|uniref:cysteine desulfurase family protein n=1 Tax=Flavobacterium sp. TaxID=239 RepID=UPI003F6A2128